MLDVGKIYHQSFFYRSKQASSRYVPILYNSDFDSERFKRVFMKIHYLLYRETCRRTLQPYRYLERRQYNLCILHCAKISTKTKNFRGRKKFTEVISTEIKSPTLTVYVFCTWFCEKPSIRGYFCLHILNAVNCKVKADS